MGTYKEIQTYIKDVLGISVKTCHIADVKAEYGINKGNSWNRIDPNVRTNPCPENKKEAIINAFRFFKMID